MSRQQNQHTVLPDSVLRPHVEYMWQMGRNDKEILEFMQDKFDHDVYTLSIQTIRRRRRAWGYDSARATKKKLAPELLDAAIRDIRVRFPKMGSRDMRARLRAEHGWWIPRDDLIAWFREHEAQLLHERRAKRFKRKRFYAAGVNHIWVMDQHDKWKRFGLWLHIGLEPYSGRILWLRVWWTNSNPRLICGYFLQSVRQWGGIPLLTQSDPGSENYGVANAQTAMRQRLDPSLQGTSQHKWKRKHGNVKPEIEWSKLRRRWSPGFEDKLDEGLNQDLYNPDDELDVLVFRWMTIPYIQQELDVYVALNNHSSRRHDRHKILPKGIPDMIFREPHRFNASLDFKIPVDEGTIREVENRWAPPGHDVFELVTPQFDALASQIWTTLGCPMVSTGSLWNVFALLVDSFRALAPDPDLDRVLQATHHSGDDGEAMDDFELIPGLRPAEFQAGISNPIPSFTLDRRSTLPAADHGPGNPGPSSAPGAPTEEEENEDEETEGLDDQEGANGLFVTFSDEDEDVFEEAPLGTYSDHSDAEPDVEL